MAAISARVSRQELSRKPYPWLPCCVAIVMWDPTLGLQHCCMWCCLFGLVHFSPPSLPLQSGMTRVAATAGGTLAGSIAATSGVVASLESNEGLSLIGWLLQTQLVSHRQLQWLAVALAEQNPNPLHDFWPSRTQCPARPAVPVACTG